jgi:hypothetical protein
VIVRPSSRRRLTQAEESAEEEEAEEEELEEEEEEEEEDSDEGEQAAAEDTHENVCHACSGVGDLVCCSNADCRHAYHRFCLSAASQAEVDARDDWHCPVCTGDTAGRAVGNPQTGRAQACAKFRSRKRGRAELSPGANRQARREQYHKRGGKAKKQFR